jgi:hypothetical protein
MTKKPSPISQEAETQLRNTLTKGRTALESGNVDKVKSSFIEIERLVKVLDPFHHAPHTAGSLAQVWYDAHWYHIDGNFSREPQGTQYFHCLENVINAVNFWLDFSSRQLEVAVRTLDDKQINLLEKSPFFKRYLPEDSSLVFVLMPFTEAWSDRVWKKHLKPAIERISCDPPLVALRADDLFGSDVMYDIFESILRARIVIADITNRNANVFYELGIAHTLGKSVIILSQGIDHIPFDLLRFRHLLYDETPGGCSRLEIAIMENIQDIVREVEKPNN